MPRSRCVRIPSVLALFLLLFFCGNKADAGDPRVTRFVDAQAVLALYATVSWMVEVQNPFPFAARSYESKFRVVNKGTAAAMEYVVPTFDFPRMTTMNVGMAPQQWTASIPGEYFVEFTSYSPDDIDTTNNTARYDFTVSSPSLLNRSEVTSLLRLHMTSTWNIDTTRALAYVAQTPWHNCPVTCKDSSEFSMTLDTTKWFAWIDLDKYSEYRKDQFFVIIDRGDGDVQRYHTTWHPIVYGESYPGPGGGNADNNIVYGEPPFPESGDGTHLSDPLPGDPLKKRACALIIAGGDSSPSAYRDRFRNGAEFMKNNLIMEKSGARINPDDVVTLIDPTKEEVQAAMQRFKDMCDTLYFVYTGHGSQYSMDIKGDGYLWIELFVDLNGINASDYQALISSCRAGVAIDRFDDVKWRYDEANVTIVASSAADTSSYSQTIVTGTGDTITVSRYLWSFVRGYGNPAADRDGDGRTSFEEAHRWVIRENPEVPWAGTRLVQMQRPQIRVHSRTKPDKETVRPPNTDLEIVPNEIPDNTATLTVQVKETASAGSAADSIGTISTARYWSIEYDTKANFSMDLKWTYNGDIDDIADTSAGRRLGIVRRDSSSAIWQRYFPTLWDKHTSTLRAIDVRGFSEWAIAAIENSAPHATGATIATMRDTESDAVHPWVADRDTGDTHVFSIVSQPANGSARIDNNAIRYAPAANFTGDDSFTFRATDEGGASVIGTAVVRVTGSNRPPIAMADTGTLFEDGDILLRVLENDYDPDGDPLRIIDVSMPMHGSAAIIDDTLIYYEPNENYRGDDTFTYTISDPFGATASADVFLRILPVNDAPGEFTRLSPSDGSTHTTDSPVRFSWTHSIDVDGDSVYYLFTMSIAGLDEFIVTADSTVEYDYSALSLPSGQHAVRWSVRATDGTDTTASMTGEGSFTISVTSTSVSDFAAVSGFAIHQLYPNPARDVVSVTFSVTQSGPLFIDIYALDGRRLHTPAAEQLVPGRYTRSISLHDLDAGMYLLRLRHPGGSATRMILLMR